MRDYKPQVHMDNWLKINMGFSVEKSKRYEKELEDKHATRRII